ncbi:MAG: AGE family epimerase/isomerase [Marinilabiliaceae bacterium]|nr:AGE family epimerase/isomerase [Marinilabiliaceae bacterium]
MIDIQQLYQQQNNELHNILKYWTDNTLDVAHGGFVGQIDHFNHVVPGASKGAVLNARILWTFSAAYRFTRQAEYLQVAENAFNYLLLHFWDKQHGGLVWEVDANGKVLNGRKQIYAQGFGVYGFSEYYRASGNTLALDKAIELYRLIEKHSYDAKDGGYIEALAQDWSPLEDMRLSPKDANEPKSMNTHLHILEPYTNLLRVWDDAGLKKQVRSLIRIFLDKIIDSQTAHFQLFFGMDWEVRSQIVSYGHDIEGAWLLTEAAHVLGDADLTAEVEKMAIRMVDVTMNEGGDADGSIFYELETDHNHLDTDKHWWPQAEAMVGLAWAWKITGNADYLAMLDKSWRFIDKYIIDRKNGEWFWRVNKDGVPYTTEDKAGFWKCPYHNSRALMEVMEVLHAKR